jgi:hypothetical protein
MGTIHQNDPFGKSAGQTIPPKPRPLIVVPDHVPTELKAIDQWVVWRHFWLGNRQKWDKPPLQSHGGNLASATNPKTWSTFEAAMRTDELPFGDPECWPAPSELRDDDGPF